MLMVSRYALYEDVVTNETLAERYRQYMIQHLGFDAAKMVPVEEAYRMHDQPGSSCVPFHPQNPPRIVC